MPVARRGGMDNALDYVVVRRTGPDGKELVDELRTTPKPTPTSTLANVRRQLDLPKLHFGARDTDDEDDDNKTRPEPPPFIITMTMTQAQATGSALPNRDPSQTVVVQITPPPPPPPHNRKGGISQTTEHLLIAAGSIGATIIIVMIILAMYTMRKRGLTLREVVNHGKTRVTRRGAPPTPPKTESWDRKPAYSADYGSIRNDTVSPPQRAMSIDRSASTSSQRPLMALQRNESFNSRQMATDVNAYPAVEPQSFLLDSPPGRNNSNRHNPSLTPSSPVIPLQNQRNTASTRNTRSMSDGSVPQYPEPPQERALSPLPPPPTFKQFLFNRPSVSGRPGFQNMESRFSWTNSNAPQTPHDPTRDTNSHTLGRESFMTQRSSVPRFRTVDSWVNQQTNRIEAQKLKEQFRMTQSTAFSTDDDRGVIPEVPEIPTAIAEASTPKKPNMPPIPPSGGLPGKNIRHERHDTRTTVETAPIFRQHPGTEVRFSTRSVVPSEILDMGPRPNVLS